MPTRAHSSCCCCCSIVLLLPAPLTSHHESIAFFANEALAHGRVKRVRASQVRGRVRESGLAGTPAALSKASLLPAHVYQENTLLRIDKKTGLTKRRVSLPVKASQ
jgi:hypothetical protein